MAAKGEGREARPRWAICIASVAALLLAAPLALFGVSLVHPVELRIGQHGLSARSNGGNTGFMRVDGTEYPPQGFHHTRSPGMSVYSDAGGIEAIPPRMEWTMRRGQWYYWLESW
jgi:hypothetical protein